MPDSIDLDCDRDDSTVSILYENSGRINYKLLDGQTMGLRKPVGLDGEFDQSWSMVSLPMDEAYLNELRYDAGDVRTVEVTGCSILRSLSNLLDQIEHSYHSAPAFYKMELVIDADNHKDTFVNMEQWTKGVVWVNGINLGRYWAEEGPATTLYLPGNKRRKLKLH